MKNIWNDPRSLFNGNHFSSYFDVLVETTTLCPSLTLAGFSGTHVKKSILECKNVI